MEHQATKKQQLKVLLQELMLVENLIIKKKSYLIGLNHIGTLIDDLVSKGTNMSLTVCLLLEVSIDFS